MYICLHIYLLVNIYTDTYIESTKVINYTYGNGNVCADLATNSQRYLSA